MKHTKTDNKTDLVIKLFTLQGDRNAYMSSMTLVVIGYAGITFWLNEIRENSSLWLVWMLIIIQLILYFSIFVISYQRAQLIGIKRFGIIPFIILAILGRVENWEIFIIPLLLITMFLLSAKYVNKIENKLKT